ncbi:MAG: glycosyltransferase [Gammaproteobacteria bacterium]|nr:glycosyltransferase [Gammaproteobacteria bacterium]MDH5802588.1 glycosyltransferase [Gammaproteobacteria bacterium]
MTSSTAAKPLNIAFMHPDLGIGGAERLIVDAAICLQQAGHKVCIYTAQHDAHRSFSETRDGSLDIRIIGSFLPISLWQRLRAPCAIVRMLYIAWAISRLPEPPDIVICDLTAHPLPLLRRLCNSKILFYCHFPDKLLTPARTPLYQCYRHPIDTLEAKGLRAAHKVVANSRFTATTVQEYFPGLKTPEVLYPGIKLEPYLSIEPVNADHTQGLIFLSINRYDPKKNLPLAVKAMAQLREILPSKTFSTVRLILAGSCDPRLSEQQQTLKHLQQLVLSLKLTDHIHLLQPCSEAEKLQLLQQCLAVIYTPINEHFGIVPLEAMASARPVIAVNSGGPLETIVEQQTGHLCPPDPQVFASVMAQYVMNPHQAHKEGMAGRQRVQNFFSLKKFGVHLNAMLQKLVQS